MLNEMQMLALNPKDNNLGLKNIPDRCLCYKSSPRHQFPRMWIQKKPPRSQASDTQIFLGGKRKKPPTLPKPRPPKKRINYSPLAPNLGKIHRTPYLARH